MLKLDENEKINIAIALLTREDGLTREVFKKFVRVGLLPEKVISLCTLVGDSYHLSDEKAETLKNQ